MIVASSRGRITSGGGIGYDVAADSAGIWATSSQISRMMAPAGPLEYNRSWYNRAATESELSWSAYSEAS